MPIEQTSFREITREKTVPLSPDELLTTAGTLEKLKLPEKVSPANVLAYLAGQSVKLTGLVAKPEVKSLESDIPEYLHQDSAFLQASSSFSREEQRALDSWHQDVGKALVKAQSGETDPGALLDELDAFFNDPEIRSRLDAAHPAPSGGGSASEPDLFDTMFTSQMIEETEDEKRKWAELVAAARSPEMVNTLLNYRKSQLFTKIIGHLMEQQKFHVDQVDKVRAEMDLGMKSADGLSTAELAKFNADFAVAQTDATQVYQQIQYALSNVERFEAQTPQINRIMDQTFETMIRNLRPNG